MILRRQEGNPLLQIRPVLSLGQLTELQDQAAGVYIQAELVDYVVPGRGHRSHPAILRGGQSPGYPFPSRPWPNPSPS